MASQNVFDWTQYRVPKIFRFLNNLLFLLYSTKRLTELITIYWSICQKYHSLIFTFLVNGEIISTFKVYNNMFVYFMTPKVSIWCLCIYIVHFIHVLWFSIILVTGYWLILCFITLCAIFV